MKIRKELVVVLLAGSALAASALNSSLFIPQPGKPGPRFHSPREMVAMKEQRVLDPIQPGEFFLHSGNCRGCHGPDSIAYANVDYNGVDINVYDDWEATMMANSSKDPLWRAKVSHEILVNPAHSLQLQNKCTSCHAPMGHYTSRYQGNLYYTLADLYNDSLGLDGVSCTGCHQIGPDGLGSLFSGEIPYDTNHIIYGPFVSPVTGPMQLYVGYTPVFSPHMSEGRACSSCHTLLTESVDLSGTPTGRTFIEQATYHEWLNSALANDFITCQNCHMPQVTDSVVIANGYLNMDPRSPFNRHKFMGSNEFMLKLMKQNKTALGITASNENYDSTIAVTSRMLRHQTLNMSLLVDSITPDTAYFTVRINNKAGHKFPSGYPSRRAVLQFVVRTSTGDTLFQSGVFGSGYEVNGVDPEFEPHHNVISDPGQVQIYQMVMGDVNGDVTTVLERGDTILKDNRIPPEGFLSSSPVYDTVKIIGIGGDPDFNLTTGGSEGTGRDYVHYHVPINNYQGTFSAYAEVFYQAVPPSWLTEMFGFNSTEIDNFRNMYNSSDRSPALVAADSVMQLALGVQLPGWSTLVNVYPDPTSDGKVNISVPQENELDIVRIYSMSGQLIKTVHPEQKPGTFMLQLPEAPGTYILEMMLDQHRIVRKVIRN